MLLAAGLFTALAMGASVAGGFLFFGLCVATVLAGTVRQRVAEPEDRVSRGLRIAALVGLLVVFATGFTSYVLPDHPQLGSAGFVVVLTVLHTLGVRVNMVWQRWLTGLLFLAAAAFVALLLAGPQELFREPDTTGSYTGLFVAAAVLFPFVNSVQRGRLFPAFLVTAVVMWAVGSQFGHVRLGLSPASLRDALVSADAGALHTVLVILVALVTGSAAVRILADLREVLERGPSGDHEEPSGHHDDRKPDQARGWQVLVLGLVGLPVTMVVTPFGALVLAAALALTETFSRVLHGPKTWLSIGTLFFCGLLLCLLVLHVAGVT